jgi:hypothetical protein
MICVPIFAAMSRSKRAATKLPYNFLLTMISFLYILISENELKFIDFIKVIHPLSGGSKSAKKRKILLFVKIS